MLHTKVSYVLQLILCTSPRSLSMCGCPSAKSKLGNVQNIQYVEVVTHFPRICCVCLTWAKWKNPWVVFLERNKQVLHFICVWFIPKFFWPKIYCVFSLGKNWPPNCFVRRSIQTTWAVLLLTVLLLYQRTRGSSRVAVTWHGFPFWTVYFLIAACLEHFWRQFFQTWKIAFRPTTFPRIAPAAPVGKNRWGWQDASALIL